LAAAFPGGKTAYDGGIMSMPDSNAPTQTGGPHGGGAQRFDCFLSYHSADREAVSLVRERLGDDGIRAFLDREHLGPGMPWPAALEQALRDVNAVVVFVGHRAGADGLGLWQKREMWFALDRQVAAERTGDSFAVIPVLLPGADVTSGFLFLNTWVDMRGGVDDSAALGALVGAIRGLPADTAQRALPDEACPYRALGVFREQDAPLYFGREASVDALLERLERQAVVALIGPSGSGKSSLVQAGLVPRLRQAHPPAPVWEVLVFRPGDRPFHRFAAALVSQLQPIGDDIEQMQTARRLGDTLAEGGLGLADVVTQRIEASNGSDRLLLVMDQAEELFSQTPAAQGTAFIDALLEATTSTAASLLLTLRADHYGRAIAASRALSDQLQQGVVNLAPMTRAELHDAITRPAAKVGLRFETGLTERIIDHTADQPGGLPLLEFALTQLWAHREGNSITHRAYAAIGEVPGAIGVQAEAVYQALPADLQGRAATAFTRLVQLAASDEEAADTQRRVPLRELDDEARAVLAPFIAARLLVVDQRRASPEPTVELAHEALLAGWERLSRWVNERRDFLSWRQRLDRQLRDWSDAGEPNGSLLRGPALREARRWSRQEDIDLNDDEQTFIRHSVRRQSLRRVFGGSLVALLALVVGGALLLRVLWQTDTSRIHQLMLQGDFALTMGASRHAQRVWFHTLALVGRGDSPGENHLGVSQAGQRFQAASTAARYFGAVGDLARARRLADRAARLALEVDGHASNPQYYGTMAIVRSAVGQAVEAAADARRAYRLAAGLADPATRTLMTALVTPMLARTGQVELAVEAIDQTVPQVADLPHDMQRQAATMALVEALGQTNDIDRAIRLAGDADDPDTWAILIGALGERGRAAQAEAVAERCGETMCLALAASIRAARGDTDAALRLAEAALRTPGGRGPTMANSLATHWVLERVVIQVLGPSETLRRLADIEDPDVGSWLALALAHLGHHEAARTVVVKLTDATAASALPPLQQLRLVRVLALGGDIDGAQRLTARLKSTILQPQALAEIAMAKLDRGDIRAARSGLADALAAVARIDDQTQATVARIGIAKLQAALGESETAVASVNEIPWTLPDLRLRATAAVLRAMAKSDDTDSASRFVDADSIAPYGDTLRWP
jgi:tetratricopeptide (TPR) repeat protein